MELHGISRFNLVTQTMPRLVAFYRDVLGMPCVGGEVAIPEGELRLLGLFGTGRRQRLMVGQQVVAIDHYDPPGQPYPDDGDAASLWFQHFALLVPDIQAAYDRLRDEMPISKGGPQQLPVSSGGVQAFKFRDPDGHPLEFLQPVSSAKAGDTRAIGIDHSAISVADETTSTAFYSELGLRPSTSSLNQGPEQERLDGLAAVHVRVVPMIPRDPAPHLELLAYRTPMGRRVLGSHTNDVAATRIVWRGTVPGLLRDPDGHLHQVDVESPA